MIFLSTVFISAALIFAGQSHAGSLCLGKLCFDAGSGSQHRGRLPEILGLKNPLPSRGAMCFRTAGNNHLLIEFLDHPKETDEIEAVTLAKANICQKNPKHTEVIRALAMQSKIVIGSSREDVEKVLGKPTYVQSGSLLEKVYGHTNEAKIGADAVYLYASNPDELLAARVFFKQGHVVGMQISVSE